MKSNVIVVKEVVSGTSTNAEGYPLLLAMENSLQKHDKIVLSLHGCTCLSTSFLNSSIGMLIEKYGVTALKSRLSIVDFTPALGSFISKYLTSVKKLSAAY